MLAKETLHWTATEFSTIFVILIHLRITLFRKMSTSQQSKFAMYESSGQT